MNRHKQQGLYIEAITLVIFLAAIAGLWTFYHFKIGGLESEVVAKQAVIETQAKEKAECLAKMTGLQTANKDFNDQVLAQNKAIEALQQARNAKAAEAAAAKAAADKQSLVYKKSIADILGTLAGVDWTKTWDKLVTDYTTARHAGGAK